MYNSSGEALESTFVCQHLDLDSNISGRTKKIERSWEKAESYSLPLFRDLLYAKPLYNKE